MNESQDHMIQKIAIAVGDSPEAIKVVESGLDLAEKFGARVLLLHVLNPLIPHGFSKSDSSALGGILPTIDEAQIQQFTEKWNAYARQAMAILESYAVKAKDRGIVVEILQNYGDSGPIICETAKTWAADLLVMGRNQRSALDEFWLGSVSNDVLHHAPCSVLVVR